MRAHVKEARTIAFAEALLLGTVAVLSASSGPPVVMIQSVPSIEEGTVVRVSGHVVDIWSWDDGTENIVLADLGSGATLRVVCRAGAGQPPSESPSVGDLVLVTGEVARSGVQTLLIVGGDGPELVSRSADALTLGDLARNWRLFEGDDIGIKGLLVSDIDGNYVLSDLDLTRSLRLSGSTTGLARLAGHAVVVTGVIVVEESTMSLEFRVDSIAPTL